jgi:hypothetical protein
MTTKGRLLHATRATAAPLADLPAAARIAETRRLLTALGGPVWDAGELEREFHVMTTVFHTAHVMRRSDGVHGTLEYHEGAQLWYGWKAGR